MLDETLVVWGGEFGRQPTAEYAKGQVETTIPMVSPCGWLEAASKEEWLVPPMNLVLVQWRISACQNLHATVLHQIGLDPNRLSFFDGLDQKLVGVEEVEQSTTSLPDHQSGIRLTVVDVFRSRSKPAQT